MYRLYGDYGSGSCVVELTLAELGLDYTTRNVDIRSNAQRAGTYEAVNPQRKLPSLECPDGGTMTESVAILLTLLENSPIINYCLQLDTGTFSGTALVIVRSDRVVSGGGNCRLSAALLCRRQKC